MKPHQGAIIDPAALKVGNKTELEIFQYPDPKDVLNEFIEYARSFGTTFQIRAYNADFDRGFLDYWFNRNMCASDLRDLFYPGSHCVLKKARELLKIRGHKLTAVCEHLKVTLENAHTAYADIKATHDVDVILDGMRPKTTLISDNMSYLDKKRRFLGPDYLTVGSDGSVHITNKCTRDEKVFTFVIEELYNQFVG